MLIALVDCTVGRRNETTSGLGWQDLVELHFKLPFGAELDLCVLLRLLDIF